MIKKIKEEYLNRTIKRSDIMDFKVSDELFNTIIVEWIIFKETHEYAWGEKRGNKFVMGTPSDGVLKEIDLINRNI